MLAEFLKIAAVPCTVFVVIMVIRMVAASGMKSWQDHNDK